MFISILVIAFVIISILTFRIELLHDLTVKILLPLCISFGILLGKALDIFLLKKREKIAIIYLNLENKPIY